ncbi:histidine kinase [Gorillibacterium sp. CAU 1737]|uniref:cache domain-containing sensor histidine kinase n=1 Tax=Gorillibacterium sp. CAU 1737 TaxID=3140362 RepID=UPI0032615980
MFTTSIRRKLMSLLLAATIIPIAISMTLSNFYIKRAVTERSIAENQSLLSLGKTNLLSYMNSLNRISLTVYNSLNSSNSLYALIEKGQATKEPEEFNLKNQMALYAHMLNMYQTQKEIHQIHLQFAGQDKLSYLMSRGFFRSGFENAIAWPADRIDDPKPFVEATHPSVHYPLDFNRSIPDADVITLRRPIIRTPSDEVIAYLSIDVQTSELNKICEDLTPSSKEELYVIDPSKTIIGTKNVPEALRTRAGQEPWMDPILSSGKDSGHLLWKDDHFSGIILYDTLKTNYMNWIIIKRLPDSYLYENANTINTINTFIITVSLIIVVIATLFISVSFTKPIKRLTRHVARMQTGHFQGSVPVQGKDEISILAQRFNTMTETINDLINREYKLELANKTNQLKAMQAQVNPHFLNNALQSIGTLALQADAPKVYSLISAIARMMRYSMNTEETLVPLSAEIEHVKAYLELQQQRFADRIEVDYAIAPSSLAIRVPKMIIQPLVENYFKHGFEPQGGTGILHITSLVEADGRLVLQVKDNGAGMDAFDLRELSERLYSPGFNQAEGEVEGDHIGLHNVAMRIRLYYGEEASIQLEAERGQGFQVTITLPFEEKKEEPE